MRMRWRWLSEKIGEPEQEIDDNSAVLAEEFHVHPLVAKLLFLRGIATAKEASAFLEPRLSHLHDPASLPGAQKAAQRLAKAIEEKQPIVVYGDYDVDGVTATAILYHLLAALGAVVKTYVPHRMDEGYGLNEEALRTLVSECQKDNQQAHPVIVSVDCGITAVEPAQVAKELGVDLIISDHHTFDPENLPDAFALVHPRLPSSDSAAEYPCPHLCGAGVAFKLAWQVAREHYQSERLPKAISDLMVDLLSLAALGTVADVVPLIGENRVLTTFGLGRIKHTRFDGLNAMIAAARLADEKISAYHIGFVLGPRLNACGRMGHAKEAVRLLTTATDGQAMELAKFLTKENERRRTTEKTILKQAKEIVEQRGFGAKNQRAIVLAQPEWHKGVIGIVASRLVDTYNRPVVMLSIEGDQAGGSARSVSGVSIHEALNVCSSKLIKFGGHAMAAGLSLATQRIDEFRSQLIKYVNSQLTEKDLVPWLDIDGGINLEDCTIDLFEQLGRLAPFGQGNRSPRLLVENVQLVNLPKKMGRNGDHLSLLIRADNTTMRAVAFNMGDLYMDLPEGVYLDVVFKPEISVWRGVKRAELHVEDLALRN